MLPVSQTSEPSARGSPAEEAATIVAFMRGYSLEATRPTAADLAALQAVAPAEAPLYLSAVPSHPSEELVEIAAAVRAAGFEPVPHLAARGFASREALDRLLARLAESAGIRRALLVAGDHARPLGPYAAAIDVIESGLLPQHGVVEIGIAAYPGGHPRISDYELARLVVAKVEAAAATGLAVHIVTQFGFDPGAILDWLERLRGDGIDCPVRIGMAGPTSATALLRYAKRCGVAASAQGLAQHVGLAKHVFSRAAPDGLIRTIAAACTDTALGRVAPHLYSFGGLGATARWAAAIAAGRIELSSGGGFGVTP
jgi:methylenetetrahydrofolate reductase (NADPH)